jgi:hypothetical protein
VYNKDEHYDLSAAIEFNSVQVPNDFEIKAEILSDNHDEGEYFWLIEDQDKNYYIIHGSHDYTGWDCQSGANISQPFKSLDQLQLFIPEFDNQNRPVRQMILDQVEQTKKGVK